MKSYCTQNNGDCTTCSLVNYDRDCCNVPLKSVPDFDNTLYWCENCKTYKPFTIYDKSWGPLRVVCQYCDNGYRLRYLDLIEIYHPAICKV